MSRFAAIQPQHVLEALRRLDAGESTNYKDSAKYDLVHEGKRYAPKRVVEVAMRLATGQSLKGDDLSGGNDDSQANGILQRLKFTVEPKSKDSIAGPGARALVVGRKYTRADVQAALGLTPTTGGDWFTGYTQHGGEWYLFPNVGVAGRTGHDYHNRWEGERLRWYGKTGTNVNQPAMRAMLAPGAVVHLFTRTADRDPFEYHGRVRPVGTPSGTPVEVLWEIVPPPTDASTEPLPEEVPAGTKYREGSTTQVTVNARERSPEARRGCIAHHGVACAVCGRTMEEMYGVAARGHIHVHHLRSLAEIGEEYEVDPVEDLRPVCPNCHAVIHLRKDRPYTLDEVRKMMEDARGGAEDDDGQG